MLIGIDASRAFLKRRTGIEEYAYQTIKHLRSVISETDTVILYVRKKIRFVFLEVPEIDFELPKNWKVKGIWSPRFWTQAALSLEMFLHPPDVLFVPAHTVPLIHPARNATQLKRLLFFIVQKFIHPFTSCRAEHSVAGGPAKTIVTIHGLEYEFCKEGYSFWARLYMRLSIRFSCCVAETVICVSENTKRDVMKLYKVPEGKIRVVYEGYDKKFQISNFKFQKLKPYLLFVGRLEERKNVVKIIEAFEILKEKYKVPHHLVLVGKPGFGYKKIRCKMQDARCKNEIQEMGYVSEEKKWELLQNADVFLFPTLYEGFGIPVLEAQSVGVPVVTSQTSSLPEVGGEGAIYVDPMSAESIAEGVWKVISDQGLKNDIIKKGLENARRFSWKKCVKEIYESIKQ